VAAPVVLVDPNPDSLAALALVPPAAPPAPAAPSAPVAVAEGEQVAPALQAEVCSFEISSPTFSLLVEQVFYRLYYVWCVRPWLFVFGRQVLFPMFGRFFDLSLLVGRKFDCLYKFGRVFDRSCLSLVVSY